MSNHLKSSSASYSEPGNGDGLLSLRDKLSNYLRYWPLFVISISICIVLAYVYLKSANPVYIVKAALLIKDEKNDQKGDEEHEVFKNSKKVDDEIEILKSRTLMGKVVADLELWIQYDDVEKFSSNDIYSTKPVRFHFISATNRAWAQTIEITIKDEHTFMIKQPHSYSKFAFGTLLINAGGSWKLEPTKDVKLYIGHTILIHLYNPEDVTDSYLNSFNAFLSNEQTSVVELSVREFVPERGEDVVNGIIKAYNLASIDYRNKVTLSTLNFLDERLGAISGELTTVEKHVEGYKSSRGITDISSESKFYLDNVKDNDSKLNEVNVQLQIINQIQNYIKSTRSSGYAPATIGISDPLLISLIDQLNKLELQRDKLLANTPEKNPIFIPLNTQINSVKVSISENINGIKRSLLATRNQLSKYNFGFESSIKKLPGQEREYVSIKRQQSIKEELYLYLLQKREEVALTNASKLVGSRVIDRAHYGAPELRNAGFAYALAFILGLILPAGVIFSKDAFNNKISSIQEIENALFVPVLGELIYKKSMTPVIMLNESRTMISEQFRILRTNLQRINGKTRYGKVTLLTSGMPGEGKSTITCNLATVMAAAGRKTVIIDADFRKPIIAKTLNLKNETGLSDYLSGNAYKEDIIQPSLVHPDLYVISTGSQLTNPSELFEKEEMEVLIDWLRFHFDEILLDTPPVKLVTDAMILSQFSDVNIYVLRYGFTYKSELNYLKQLYNDSQIKNLKIIFNGVSPKGAYGYSNGYVYQYYSHDKLSV